MRPAGRLLGIAWSALLWASFSAHAETLLLSATEPRTNAAGQAEIDCSYTPFGTATRSASEVVGFTVIQSKSALDRLLAGLFSSANAKPVCPSLVTRSVAIPPKETYGDCVLKHMQGTTSEAAAYAVKGACIRAAEFAINTVGLDAISSGTAAYWRSPYADGRWGLFITINNNSAYTFSELVLQIITKSSKAVDYYALRAFPRVTPGMTFVGSPKDPSVELTLTPGLHTFYAPIRETTTDPSKWGGTHAWGIVGAMGFTN